MLSSATTVVVALTLVQLFSVDADGTRTWLLSKLQNRRQNSQPPPIMPANKVQPKDLKKCRTCPRPREYKLKRLMRKIGHLNSKYLSVSKPSLLGPKVEKFSYGAVKTSQKKLIRELLRKQHVSHKIEKTLLRWLLKRSFCPLEHKWTDFGSLFWPRWIKIARCVGKPCSWPDGMSCSTSSRTFVSVLRWHCRPRGSKRNRKRYLRRSKYNRKTASRKSACQWLKIKYPVTTKCSCSCDQSN